MASSPGGAVRPGREAIIHDVMVIGMGQVGRRLAGAMENHGWKPRPVTRADGWQYALDETDTSPRVVAVREEDLSGVLSRFPAVLRDRLVLVQNGFLEAVHPDLGPVTRGLIYFTSKADFFRVLRPSTFHGPHAGPVARALADGGITAKEEPTREGFLREMILKGIWNAVVGLPLAVHEVDLEAYLGRHRDEMLALVAESAAAAGAEYSVEVRSEDAVREIEETTRELGWVRGGKKALPWRNGAVAWFGRRHGVPTPVNDRLLEAVGYDPACRPATAV